MEIIQEIALDLYYENCFQTIIAKQLDENSRAIKVRVTDKGKKVDVPEDANVIINIRRSDNKAKAFFGETNGDGTITVPLPNWMLLIDGRSVCDISIIEGDKRISTLNFYVDAEFSPVTDEDIQNDENYSVLVKLIGDVKNAELEIDKKFNTLAEVAKTGNFNDLVFDWDTVLIIDGGYADIDVAKLDETVLE